MCVCVCVVCVCVYRERERERERERDLCDMYATHTQDELKAKIEAFMASKRLEMTNSSMASAGGDTSMDAA